MVESFPNHDDRASLDSRIETWTESLGPKTRAAILAVVVAIGAPAMALVGHSVFNMKNPQKSPPATATPPEGGEVAPVKIEDADPANPIMPIFPEETPQQSLAGPGNPGPVQ
jgi:hypothetical protein